MAIEIKLEKYGYKKKGFLGFSWTVLFFNFFVPIFRGDIKWTIIFFIPYILLKFNDLFFLLDFENDYNYFILLLPVIVTRFVFPFIYNDFYTKDLLKQGYLPAENDDYSNAILKGNRYLEYTNEDLLDKEKMERYRLIIEEYEKERKKDIISAVMFFSLLGVLILFFYFMVSFG